MENEMDSIEHIGDIIRRRLEKGFPQSPVPEIKKSDSYFTKLRTLKLYYETYWDEIEAHHKRNPYSLYRSYPFDWANIFTPIEHAAWNSIRCKGRLPLYPQFPVDGFIIDFADPFLKIGLELDGAEFHNVKKDTGRDKHLKSLGWTIYRITGKEMLRTNYQDWSDYTYTNHHNTGEVEIEDDDIVNLKYWLTETGDGVIEAIKTIHYSNYYPLADYILLPICQLSLSTHQLVK